VSRDWLLLAVAKRATKINDPRYFIKMHFKLNKKLLSVTNLMKHAQV